MRLILFTTLLLCGTARAQTWTYVDIPDAFCSKATISFDLTTQDSVTLDVYDHRGNTIQTFYAKTPLTAGHYMVTLPGDTLSQELYIIRYSDTRTQLVKDVTKSCATGVTDAKAQGTIMIYPNPARDILHVDKEGEKHMFITDMLGQVHTSATQEAKALDISSLPAGDYLISVFDKEGAKQGAAMFSKGK